MATASPSAVLAVPERPLPERPEAKGTDGPDGQFAGLMAQLAPPHQPPAKAPEAQPQRPGKSDRQAKVDAPDDSGATKPTPTAIREKSCPKEEAKNAKADPAKPTADPVNGTDGTKVSDDGTQATLEKPSSIQAALNELAALAPPLPPVSLPQTSANTESLTPKFDSTPSQPTQPLPLPAVPLPTTPKLQVGQEPPESKPLQAEPTPKPEVPTAISSAQQAPLPPPTTETAPQVEPTQPQIPVAAQAVLAESAAPSKPTQPLDEHPSQDETQKTDSSRLQDKVAKALDAPPPPRPAAPSLTQSFFQATPPITDQERASSAAKTSAAPTTWIDPAPPTVDTTVAKAGLSAQTPLARPSDGSAMAAMNALARPQESPTPTAVVAAAPPPATPPTAPVSQVEGGIRWMLKGGVQEAQLQLHPDSLGQVTIHLKVEGGEVHARLWVTEPASVQAVQEGRTHLEMSLKEQGLQLGSFDLQQGHRPFQEPPSTPTYREQATPEVIATRQEAPPTILPSLLNPHRVELYA